MYIAYGLKCGDCHDSAPPREVTYHASSHSACHFECHLFPSQKMRSLLQRSIGRLGQGPLPGCENTRSHCWAVTETQGHTARLGQRHKVTLLGWDRDTSSHCWAGTRQSSGCLFSSLPASGMHLATVPCLLRAWSAAFSAGYSASLSCSCVLSPIAYSSLHTSCCCNVDVCA